MLDQTEEDYDLRSIDIDEEASAKPGRHRARPREFHGAELPWRHLLQQGGHITSDLCAIGLRQEVHMEMAIPAWPNITTLTCRSLAAARTASIYSLSRPSGTYHPRSPVATAAREESSHLGSPHGGPPRAARPLRRTRQSRPSLSQLSRRRRCLGGQLRVNRHRPASSPTRRIAAVPGANPVCASVPLRKLRSNSSIAEGPHWCNAETTSLKCSSLRQRDPKPGTMAGNSVEAPFDSGDDADILLTANNEVERVGRGDIGIQRIAG